MKFPKIPGLVKAAIVFMVVWLLMIWVIGLVAAASFVSEPEEPGRHVEMIWSEKNFTCLEIDDGYILIIGYDGITTVESCGESE